MEWLNNNNKQSNPLITCFIGGFFLWDPGIIIINKLTILLSSATPGVSVITSVNNTDLYISDN